MAALQTEPAGLQSISTLLENLTSCLSSTASSLPQQTRDEPSDVAIVPPEDGISLLDTKSDLLISYLHNLVFLTLFQIRGLSKSTSTEDSEAHQSLQDEIVQKLTELRIYLDRGVRPLEGRLKYQVDKVIKAAEDADRAERTASHTKTDKKAESGSEDDSDGSSEEDDSEEDEDIDEMAYRPNVSAFTKKMAPEAKADKSTTAPATSDGIYRPPKIMPTSLPTTERKERKDRGLRRSNVIDEFVNAEMSSAPMAEASIGSMITRGGRHTKSKKEREVEAERTTYEETNFTRLAKESKKDKAKRLGAGGAAESGFGGEEWKGLTEGADRISKLTRRARGSGGALDRSRKRKGVEDGPRDDGAVGQIFEKRRKKIEGWKR